MSEPMSCCRLCGGYCDRCDVLVDLPGLHVIDVARDAGGRLTVTVESPPTVMGCPACGVIAHGHGAADRCARVRAPGADRVAQAPLAMSRTRLSNSDVRRAERRDRGSAGEADNPGLLVGDRSTASRAWQRQRDPGGSWGAVAHRVGGDPTAAAGRRGRGVWRAVPAKNW